MEDGCSKRFDIGTLDIRAEGYGGMSSMSRPGRLGVNMATGPGLLPPIGAAPTSRGMSGNADAQMQGQWER